MHINITKRKKFKRVICAYRTHTYKMKIFLPGKSQSQSPEIDLSGEYQKFSCPNKLKLNWPQWHFASANNRAPVGKKIQWIISKLRYQSLYETNLQRQKHSGPEYYLFQIKECCPHLLSGKRFCENKQRKGVLSEIMIF